MCLVKYKDYLVICIYIKLYKKFIYKSNNKASDSLLIRFVALRGRSAI